MSEVDAGREQNAANPTDSGKKNPSPALVLALCSGATFIAFLDFFVVNIAFPDISRDFAPTSITTLTWVVSSYAAMFAASLAPAGRLADSIGRRRVFLWALIAFTIASVGCGLAPSVDWLIVARVLQGLAAGGMVPAALGLILGSRPPQAIPQALAVWSAVTGFSAVVGPAVGGLLLSAFGWRSVFFINLPLGILLLIGAMVVLTRGDAGSGSPLPDAVGSVALGLGIAGVVVALTEGDTWGWGDARTLVIGLVGLALIAFTVLRSRGHRAPALDIPTWRARAYTSANIGLALLTASMFAWNLAAPLFATTIWRWSVLGTAGGLTIGAVASMTGSLLAGRITDPGRRLWVAVSGGVLLAASNVIWASALFGPTPNFWTGWLPAAVLGGLGLGLGLTCLSTIAVGSVAPQKFAGGLGMTLAVRQVGGAVGVAGFAAIIVSGQNTLDSVSSFHDVFVVATVVSLSAALIVATLRIRSRSTAQATG